LNKKIIIVIFIVLLFMAGILAISQESLPFFTDNDSDFTDETDMMDEDMLVKAPEDDDSASGSMLAEDRPQWMLPVRWFRSNTGGMALEEIPSRLAALRHEYALVIDYTSIEELPDYLLQYYDDQYYIEIRILFKNGEELRRQWIFRDINATTRVLAVIIEADNNDDNNDDAAVNEAAVIDNTGETFAMVAASSASADAEDAVVSDAVASADVSEDDSEDSSSDVSLDADKDSPPVKQRGYSGFIEIYDENSFLISEIKLLEEGKKSKTEYYYKEHFIVRSRTWLSEKEENYKALYTDYYRYNRSSFLRAVERLYHTGRVINISENIIRIAFPNRILEDANEGFFVDEKLNPMPEFFGVITAAENSKILFTTDERGRIATQTLYDKEDNIIWVIVNTWSNDRIVSMSKTEDEIELLAEYEYDSKGKRILERNMRNGVLERLVRTNDNIDIEELYINNIVVLQAVWEDGRKISESRKIKN